MKISLQQPRCCAADGFSRIDTVLMKKFTHGTEGVLPGTVTGGEVRCQSAGQAGFGQQQARRKQACLPRGVQAEIAKPNPGLAQLRGGRRQLDSLKKPLSRAGKTLAQEVTGVRAVGFGVQLGDAQTGYVSPDVLSQVQIWLDALVDACDTPLFLVIDEAQQIAVANKDQNVAAALRSALQAHGHGITQFFTGSSQDQLARMFDDAAAPFYQHAQRLDLPSFDAISPTPSPVTSSARPPGHWIWRCCGTRSYHCMPGPARPVSRNDQRDDHRPRQHRHRFGSRKSSPR